MNAKIINMLKMIGFIALVSLCISFSFKALVYKDTGGGGGFDRLENLPENSVDVIFFGNSHCHCTVDQGFLWDNYGMAGFTFTAGSQPIDSTASFVEYAVSIQNPKVIVVEISGIFADELDSDYVDIYRNLVGMDYSLDYVDRALTMAKSIGNTFECKFELLTKYPLVHNRYRELGREDYVLDIPYMMGYKGSMETVPYERPSVEEWTSSDPISEDVLSQVEKIVDIAKENNVELVFFAAPLVINQHKQERYNAFEKYADSNSLLFVNFNNLYDELALDFATDFRDPDHLNNRGAVKVTSVLAEKIKSKYKIPDRRGDKKYILWDMNSRYLQDKSIRNNLSPEVDFNTYMNAVNLISDRYVSIIRLSGNYMAIPENYSNGLEDCGITREDFSEGGCIIVENGKVSKQLTGEYSYCISTPKEEIHIDSKRNRFLIDGVNYELPDNSIGVIIYDFELGYLVDVVSVDIYQDGTIVKHPSIDL
ncbi:MAG: hypothetical protein MJ133_01055 [Lachnospiraceae bacterium]|nr:hypothetical protein [Lachnospiraceae bacterium]